MKGLEDLVVFRVTRRACAARYAGTSWQWLVSASLFLAIYSAYMVIPPLVASVSEGYCHLFARLQRKQCSVNSNSISDFNIVNGVSAVSLRLYYFPESAVCGCNIPSICRLSSTLWKDDSVVQKNMEKGFIRDLWRQNSFFGFLS